MEANLEKKISKLIESNQLRTITVDVFDTILKYDYWPRDLRYYDLAVYWTPTMQRFLCPSLTSSEIYEWLSQSERALADSHMSTRIDILIETIVASICNKYDIQLSEDDKIELFAMLISLEIQFEIQSSKPNTALAAILRNVKQSHPEIKIYFVAHSHLVADQIRILLHINHLDDLFDNGISFCELDPASDESEFFAQLPRAFGDSFQPQHNLHIGDQRYPDFLAPRQHDSLAIHYRPIRFRGLRTLVGSAWLRLIDHQISRHDHHHVNSLAPRLWQQYGNILGEIDQIWSQKVQKLALQHPATTYLLTHSCAHLASLSPSHPSNLLACPALSETTLIQAYIWLLATYESDRWDADSILKALTKSKNFSRTALYQLCFNNYTFSELAIHSFSEEAFYSHFLQEVRQADPTYTTKLRQAYESILSLLPSSPTQLVIIQTTPDHTAELFQNFLQLFNFTNQVTPYYLDSNSQVFSLTSQVKNLDQHLSLFTKGKTDSINSFRETWTYPDHYYQEILLPALARTVKSLTK